MRNRLSPAWARAALIGLCCLLSSGLAFAGPVPPADALRDPHDVRAVFQIRGDVWRDGVGEGLYALRKIGGVLEKRFAVGEGDRSLVAVVHGAAGYWLLRDAPYAAHLDAHPKAAAPRPEKGAATNPHAALVAGLLAAGIQVEICASTMKRFGWTADDILPGVTIVPAALVRVIDLQQRGYAHLVFD